MTRQRALGLATLGVMTGLGVMAWRLVRAPSPPAVPHALAIHAQARSPIPPDPTNRFADSAAAAAFGRRVFDDASFSSTGDVSCASCHDPQRAFTDGLPVAKGVGVGKRNTPTILGAARRRWFTWDGRADTMWSQAAEPIEQPSEHDFDRTRFATRVRDDASLREPYELAFGPLPTGLADIPAHLAARPPLPGEDGAIPVARAWEALTAEQRFAVNEVFSRGMKALGAFQRTLDMPLSRFDRWAVAVAQGAVRAEDPDAGGILSAAERRGWLLFSGKAGCIQCHSGREFTDGEFHNLGLPGPDGRLGGDAGRRGAIAKLKGDAFSSAGEFSDDRTGPEARLVESLKEDPETWGQFRTPSLRGLAKTAPYMHDGRFGSLDEVIEFYDTLDGAIALDHHREAVLKPLGLTPAERIDLRSFLGALDPEPAAR